MITKNIIELITLSTSINTRTVTRTVRYRSENGREYFKYDLQRSAEFEVRQCLSKLCRDRAANSE